MSAQRPDPAILEPIAAPVVDAHSHTFSSRFADDYAATMARAWAAGLVAVVEVGGGTPSGELALALARADPRVHAVAGIHPHSAKQLPEQARQLRELVEAGGFVAIGEIGLDFYRNLSPMEDQFEALSHQLELARAAGLPVVIHSRDADEETFTVLQEWALRVGRYLGADRELGMLHCYSGDMELAARYIDLGFLISIPGPVTYPNNDQGQAVARTIPLAKMVVETDAPALTPQFRRGKRNEPAYVVETVRFVAALRDTTPEEVARTTAENAARLFDFDLAAMVAVRDEGEAGPP